MQPPPTRSLRATFALLALLVSLVGAWTPHCRANRSGPSVPHVEAAGAQTCPAPHNEGRCVACQAMSLRVVMAQAAQVGIPDAVVSGGCRRTAGFPSATAVVSPTQPRAPPGPIL